MLFKSHKSEFEEGVHFFKVTGGSLRVLKERLSRVKNLYAAPSPLIGKFANSQLLWTEQGVARLSKLIDTPQAWELFTALEKCYFNSAPAAPDEKAPLCDEEQPPVKKTLKPLVPVAVVYAVLFANMLVKIGITCDFYRRLKELRKETHQDIAEFITTPFKPLDDARLLELTLKAKFFAHLVSGEFFNCPFDDVKAALVAPDDKFNKLLTLAREIQNPDEKDRLLLQAAAVLA